MSISLKNESEIKILIVDDSALMRSVLRTIIDDHSDFNICAEAEDGIDALEKLKEHEPNVILLDIEMPRMNGIEFLKRSKLLTDAKVVIISSMAKLGSPHALEALYLGVSDIIPKPAGALSLDMGEQRSHELIHVIRYYCEKLEL